MVTNPDCREGNPLKSRINHYFSRLWRTILTSFCHYAILYIRRVCLPLYLSLAYEIILVAHQTCNVDKFSYILLIKYVRITGENFICRVVSQTMIYPSRLSNRPLHPEGKKLSLIMDGVSNLKVWRKVRCQRRISSENQLMDIRFKLHCSIHERAFS